MHRDVLKAWITLAALLLLVGCNSNSGSSSDNTTPSKTSNTTPEAEKTAKKPVDISFWYSYGGRNREVTEELIGRFNAAHPTINVKATFQGDYFEALAKIRIASRTKRGPVATHIIGEAIPQLFEAGLLQDLDGYAKGEGGVPKLDKDDFIPALTQDGYFDYMGAKVPLVALPFNRSTPIAFYNMRIFKEAGLKPPETWDELIDVSTKLTVREGDNTKVWGFELPVDWWFWYALLHQAGGRLLSEDGSVSKFHEEPGTEALGLLVDMVKKHKNMKHPPGRDYNAWETANTDFLNERVAMIWTSTAFLNYFQTNAKFPVGTAFLPKKVKRAVPTGGTFFVVMKNKPEAEKQAAYTFIRWMTEPKQTQYWSMQTGYMPVRKSAVESDEMKAFYTKNPTYRTTIDQLEHAVKMPFTSHLIEIQRKILKPKLELPVVKETPVKEVLANAAKDADAVLQQKK